MITIEKTSVMNLENSIRGMRNPMNSWERIDSHCDENGNYILGQNDLTLATKLARAGSVHRKFMRQIFISVDIKAPLYWWKEFDTYKVGTTANSTSTMHKIHSKEFELADFSCDKMTDTAKEVLIAVIKQLESLRKDFLESKDKQYWYSMIQLLPSSYNQLRTCTLNYENLVGIYAERHDHKLDEWHDFCTWIEGLPYSHELIIMGE